MACSAIRARASALVLTFEELSPELSEVEVDIEVDVEVFSATSSGSSPSSVSVGSTSVGSTGGGGSWNTSRAIISGTALMGDSISQSAFSR